MSTAESEVVEAIAETEETQEQTQESGIDMAAAVEELASDLFPSYKKEEKEEPSEETTEETTESLETEEEVEEEAEEVESKPAPQSWKKEMGEAWGKLDPEVQDYIELRESQMKEGVEVKKQDADLGMRLRDAFTPFSQVLKQNNVDPVQASQKLMAAHMQIISSPMEKRKELFEQLRSNYGITDEEVDPKYQAMMNKINQLEQESMANQQKSQQEKAVRIEAEVTAFADNHPHFEDLEGEIAKLIRADYDLEDAYKIAYRASNHYEKDIETKQQEKQEKAREAKKKEAEKAKKAKAVNVRGRDTSKAPTAPLGTMDDTMHDIYREIKNRN